MYGSEAKPVVMLRLRLTCNQKRREPRKQSNPSLSAPAGAHSSQATNRLKCTQTQHSYPTQNLYLLNSDQITTQHECRTHSTKLSPHTNQQRQNDTFPHSQFDIHSFSDSASSHIPSPTKIYQLCSTS
jgi:hypothetical protein